MPNLDGPSERIALLFVLFMLCISLTLWHVQHGESMMLEAFGALLAVATGAKKNGDTPR